MDVKVQRSEPNVIVAYYEYNVARNALTTEN
jgi:hypothetical protein